MALAAEIDAWSIFAGSFISFVFLLLFDVFFFVIYMKELRTDASFKYWADRFRFTSKVVPFLALAFNFKLFRLFYSRLFGLDHFVAPFEQPEHFYRTLVFVSILHLIFSVIPLVISDIIAFAFIEWGYQLLITCIESFMLSTALIILTIIELFRLKRLLVTEQEYMPINAKTFDQFAV